MRPGLIPAALLSVACLAAVFATGCTTSGPTASLAPAPPATTPSRADTSVAAPAQVSGLGQVTNIVAPDDGSGRLFVTDQVGVVRVVRDGVVSGATALDIRSKVGSSGSEQGLLGLAFPSGFAAKQRAYLYFTDTSGTSRVYRIRVDPADPDAFDAASMRLLLSIPQPYANHNGGQLAFGPDGYLYLGFGDGGGAGDPGNRARDLGVLLGKILRIDVESAPDAGYSIPPDNPFVGRAGARPEIWAYGLRNPWRFGFDPATRDLWIADVGQDKWEEVDFVGAGTPAGLDFGWPLYEGDHLFKATSKGSGVVWPVAEYPHPTGESITGGFVYRGTAYPAAQGLYVFADYVTGRMWTVRRSGTSWIMRLVATTTWNISTFGVDGSGELWAADRTTGTIHPLGDLSK